MSERAPDRSRISMKEAHQIRYWTEALGCSKDELAAAVAEVGIQLMRYAVLFTELGHTGGSELLRHKRRQRGHERQDGHASEREGARRMPPSRPRALARSHPSRGVSRRYDRSPTFRGVPLARLAP
jgi:Protein of unknown function (DUF3606)